jgi:hypothetical protein
MKNIFSRNLISLLSLLLICGVLGIGKMKHEFHSATPGRSIAWDVFGYYLYLPSTFIYHDPGLQHKEWIDAVVKKDPPSPTIYQFSPGQKGRQVNTYPMGLAAFYAPGFFIAYAYAKVAGYPTDGFSAPYQWSLVFTAIFFACLGVVLLRMLLLKFFSDVLTGILLLLSFLATNYLFHAGFDGTMPHNFMFVLNCLILLFTIRWHETFKVRYAVFLALALGWATISRPTELIWILVPLFWGVTGIDSAKEKWKLLKSQRNQLFVFGITLVLTGMPQLLYWKWTTGHWTSYNHGEGFAFLDPYTFQFLFSFKKGWLIYTPLMILAILGFIPLYKQRRDLFYPLFIFFAINLYVLSSWECWWYAASFSQRPMVESYCLMAIPLGFFLKHMWEKSRWTKTTIVILPLFFLLLNLFQTWQMLNGVIDPERMTMAFYWRMFGRTTITWDDCKLLEVARGNTGVDTFMGNEKDFTIKPICNLTYEKPTPDWGSQNITDTLGFESTHSYRMTPAEEFSPNVKMRYYDLTDKDYAWVRASVEVFPLDSYDVSNSFFAVSVQSYGRTSKYIAKGLNEIKAKPGKWNKISIDFMTPYIRHSSDHICISYWNTGKHTVYIDNLYAELWEPK